MYSASWEVFDRNRVIKVRLSVPHFAFIPVSIATAVRQLLADQPPNDVMALSAVPTLFKFGHFMSDASIVTGAWTTLLATYFPSPWFILAPAYLSLDRGHVSALQLTGAGLLNTPVTFVFEGIGSVEEWDRAVERLLGHLMDPRVQSRGSCHLSSSHIRC